MPHMKEFLAAYPEIRLDATLTDETVDLIDSGADVGIRIGALEDSESGSRRNPAPHRRLLAASEDYLRARAPIEQPADLKEHECLSFTLLPFKVWYYRKLDNPAGELSQIEVGGHLRTNDTETLRNCAALSGSASALVARLGR